MFLAEENDALFKEIEEELRHDKASQLWKSYGKYIMLGVTTLIITVAVYQFWHTSNLAKKMERGEAFDATQSILDSDSDGDVILALREFSKNNDDGYSKLAKFKEAAILSKGEKSEAIIIYRELSTDNSLNQHLRKLAIILGAFQQLETKPPAPDLINEATKLNQLTSPWRHSAREIIALNALQIGEKSKAISILKRLLSDSTTPRGISTRSKKILNQIE